MGTGDWTHRIEISLGGCGPTLRRRHEVLADGKEDSGDVCLGLEDWVVKRREWQSPL